MVDKIKLKNSYTVDQLRSMLGIRLHKEEQNRILVQFINGPYTGIVFELRYGAELKEDRSLDCQVVEYPIPKNKKFWLWSKRKKEFYKNMCDDIALMVANDMSQMQQILTMRQGIQDGEQGSTDFGQNRNDDPIEHTNK